LRSKLAASIVLALPIGGCATQDTVRLPPEPVYLNGDARRYGGSQHWSAQRPSSDSAIPPRRDWGPPTPSTHRGNARTSPPPPTYAYGTQSGRHYPYPSQPRSAAGRWVESPRGYPIGPSARGAMPEESGQPNLQPHVRTEPAFPQTRYGTARAGGPVGPVGQPFMVQVRPGDTIYGVARRFGVGVNELMTANNLPDARIEAGQVLLLPNR
jgi:hypothetical protein